MSKLYTLNTALNHSLLEAVNVRHMGCQEYSLVWQQLKVFTNNRTQATVDEIWALEHYPVFTQGQAGLPAHLINPGLIPVVKSDRGGQVTYHGPGQLIIYFLADLRRKKINIRTFIDRLLQSVVEVLSIYNIDANIDKQAIGVYVKGAKICSLGLRVRHGCTYHGLSLNVGMDLEPFNRINPCGYPGLRITQLRDYVNDINIDQVCRQLLPVLKHNIGYI